MAIQLASAAAIVWVVAGVPVQMHSNALFFHEAIIDYVCEHFIVAHTSNALLRLWHCDDRKSPGPEFGCFRDSSITRAIQVNYTSTRHKNL